MKKENNEFIIGLGGCGGRSIREFKRMTVSRKADFDELIKEGTHIDYLYIDSSNDIYTSNDWIEAGDSLKLDSNQVYWLKPQGQVNVGDLAKDDHIKPWLGELENNYDKLVSGDANSSKSLQTLKGAGQLRRFGRVLFASQIRLIGAAVEKKIAEMTHLRENKVRFRIFCSLNGGTGSGGLIDLITLIRQICTERSVEGKIIVYAYVAGPSIASSNSSSFFENEFCSLRDLNSLILGTYHPHMPCIMGPGVNPDDCRFDLDKYNGSVNRVWLSSDLAPGSPNIDEQVRFVTAACFDSIVYELKHNNSDCLKAISDEDLVDTNPGEPNRNKQLVRSYRFAALGTHRMRVPTDKIRELLKYETCNRVWGAFLGGSKLPERTFRNTEKLDDFDFGFDATETAELYNKAEEEFQKHVENLYNEIRLQKRRDGAVLTDLRNNANEVVLNIKKLKDDQNQRGRFSESDRRTVDNLKSHLLSKLDKAITWDTSKTDVWGLNDVLAYLEYLEKSLDNWVNIYAPKSKNEEIEEMSAKIISYMEAREAEWEKLGFLTIHFTSLDEKMLEAQYQDALSLVRVGAKMYKKVILEGLVSRMKGMIVNTKDSVKGSINLIKESKDKGEQKIKQLLAELDLSGDSQRNKTLDIYVHDKENLKNVRIAMEKQTDLHAEKMSGYSQKLKEAVEGGYMVQCGQNALDKIKADVALLDDMMVAIHDRACGNTTSLQSVLVGNIFQRLRQIGGEYQSNWNARLGNMFERLVTQIRQSVNITPSSGMINPQRTPVGARVVGLPPEGEDPELYKWIIKKISSSTPAECNILLGREETYAHQAVDEISILHVQYWMPCRFADVVNQVEDKYRKTLFNDSRNILYFANYDESGEDKSKKFNRLPLTLKAEPNVENITKTELVEKLFIRVNGEVEKVMKRTDRGIVFATGVDKYEGVKYTEPCPEMNIDFPSNSYKDYLDRALQLAIKPSTQDDWHNSMTKEEQEEIANDYKKKVKEAKDGSTEWYDAREKLSLVLKCLELQ